MKVSLYPVVKTLCFICKERKVCVLQMDNFWTYKPEKMECKKVHNNKQKIYPFMASKILCSLTPVNHNCIRKSKRVVFLLVMSAQN